MGSPAPLCQTAMVPSVMDSGNVGALMSMARYLLLGSEQRFVNEPLLAFIVQLKIAGRRCR